MNNKWIQILVVLVSLIAVGEVMRFPQQSLTEELQEKRIIEKRLSSDNQLKLGQTGAAVVLGGLRSIVAAFMNLQALGEYEKQDWVELENLFDMIVTLQPQNTYYWQAGSWHLGYDAYSDYSDKLGMAPPQRRQKQREYLKKAENFLLRGTEENPDNYKLWQQLGRFFTDAHKPYNFKKAAEYLEKVASRPHAKPGEQREYFYALGRVAGREAEALAYAQKLIQDPANDKFTSMRSHYYALHLFSFPEEAEKGDLQQQIWGENKKRAYLELCNYWCRTEREGFPRANMDVVINKLQQELNLRDEMNPIKNANLRRLTGSFWLNWVKN